MQTFLRWTSGRLVQFSSLIVKVSDCICNATAHRASSVAPSMCSECVCAAVCCKSSVSSPTKMSNAYKRFAPDAWGGRAGCCFFPNADATRRICQMRFSSVYSVTIGCAILRITLLFCFGWCCRCKEGKGYLTSCRACPCRPCRPCRACRRRGRSCPRRRRRRPRRW